MFSNVSVNRKANFILRSFIGILVLIFSSTLCFAQFPGKDLLRNKKTVEVPFEYVQGFIVLNVDFNRFLPLKFIFDTGAENTLVLKKDLTDLLGLTYTKKINLVGSDLSSTIFAYISRNVILKFANSGNFRQDILVLEQDLNNLDRITGMNIDGIVGANVFKNLVVEIDYKRSKLRFHDPDYYEGPPKGYSTIDLEIKRNKPYVICKTGLGSNNDIDLKLLLDSGASLNYLLHENTHPDVELPQYVIPGKIGTGISGNLTGYMGKVNFLKLGEFQFNRITTSFQNLDESILEDTEYVRNGIIGNKILERFTVIIDYPNQKLHLKARRWSFRKPFIYDKSGLIIFAIGRNFDRYYIKDVIPDTPADLAGLQAGDYIVKFNGYSTKFQSLESITNTLSKRSARKIRMTVIRGAEKIKVSFRLEDFLEKNIQSVPK